MGTKPDKDVYEAGVVCPVCEIILFEDITPKYVEVLFVDIKACPGNDDHPPNGVFRLTQMLNPCMWTYTCEALTVTWQLLPDRSNLTLHVGMEIWFAAEVMEICLSDFENTNTCAGFPEVGHGGWGSVYWGPNIGPPLIDPSYEVGDRCPTCNAVLFNCFTPKYVEVTCKGVKRCPGNLGPLPNTTTRLTQIAPCEWQDIGATFKMTWTLGGVFSQFIINDWLDRRIFADSYAQLCGTHFQNYGIIKCIEHPLQEAHSGEADIKWGDEMIL